MCTPDPGLLRKKRKFHDQLQWDSIHRTPTWYNNTWEAGVGFYEAGAIYLSNDNKVYDSRFILREKLRMGVVKSQDEALTVDQLLLIGDIADKDWVKSNPEEEKKELESMIAFDTIEFCMSLQGEEVPLILIEGLNMLWKDTRNHLIPHMMMNVGK